MKIIKRDGTKEDIKLDKVTRRVQYLCTGLKIDPIKVSQKAVSGLYDGITSRETDELLAETAALMVQDHPNYAKLAGRIFVTNLHKETSGFYETAKALTKQGIMSKEFSDIVSLHGKKLEKLIDYERDLNFDYFGLKTLAKSYLLKDKKGRILERPQDMYMRVAVFIARDNIEEIESLYNSLSLGEFSLATPTMFNAGLKCPQMSSCFLMGIEDSISGIYKGLSDCAEISKMAGGIGIHVSDIRASGANIKGTNGVSNGIVPMLKVFNETARYVDQCFGPSTIIYTTEGAKEFKDIRVGDFVIAENGLPERVGKIFVKNFISGEDDIYKLRTRFGIRDVLVTGAHPFKAIKADHQNKDVQNNRIERGLIKEDWIDARDLDIETSAIRIIKININEPADLKAEDYRFYGMMIGDGSISRRDNNDCRIYLGIKKDINFVKEYLSSKGIEYFVDHLPEMERIRFSNNKKLPLILRENLYDNNREKIIHKSLLNIEINKALQIVKGLIETDGYGHKNLEHEFAIDITSKNVIENLRYILLRAGIHSSGAIIDRVGESHEAKNGVITCRKIAYRIRIPKVATICELFGHSANNTTKNSFLEFTSGMYSRVKKLERTEYSGLVYDLETEGPTHTYMTEAGLVHNGGGKRKGGFAIYIEPWHDDIDKFLDMKLPTGKEEFRARDLFYALWVPDLFMERIEADGDWSLFCPSEAKGLSEVYGNEFKALYEKYEADGLARRTIKARDLWTQVLNTQIKTGLPYICYKDAVNKKSNQANIGIVKSSNLCLHGDTLVVTKDGHFPIKDLVGKEVEIYDGVNWVKNSSFTKTGTSVKLLNVKLRDGQIIQCTPEHFFPLEDGTKIRASELVKGQRILTHQASPDHVKENSDATCKCVQSKNRPTFNEIESISESTELSDTYCTNVPSTNNFALSCGLMSGNCAEITEVSDTKETAVCNLASINLSALVKSKEFDFKKLSKIVKIAIRNLNKVIDLNHYPTKETKLSNSSHRPVGLGVQGLADVFFKLGIPYDSEKAREFNKEIFENMYLSALEESCEQAILHGAYSTFKDSPASQGILQYDMWGVTPKYVDYTKIKEKIQKHGLRNSLLLAMMPTASTASILGNCESFEALTSNLYTRSVLSGEFVQVNRHLVKDLDSLGLWNDKIKEAIISNKGSIQAIDEIPAEVREVYKTVWEISNRCFIDMAKDRGAFICQSQSMNLYLKNPNIGALNTAHFYGWKAGLKTGMYYLRMGSAVDAVSVGMSDSSKKDLVCSIDNKEDCEACGS